MHNTVYRQDAQAKWLYRQAWYDAEQQLWTEHVGKVGYQGKITTLMVAKSAVEQLTSLRLQHAAESAQLGYAAFPSELCCDMVVQYPLKSAMGNQRDAWLQDKVSTYLNECLGWTGLGHVDGSDRGQHKLNVFCQVVWHVKALSSIKSCLRTSRLDFNRARIASKTQAETTYCLQYAHTAITDFSL